MKIFNHKILEAKTVRGGPGGRGLFTSGKRGFNINRQGKAFDFNLKKLEQELISKNKPVVTDEARKRIDQFNQENNPIR